MIFFLYNGRNSSDIQYISPVLKNIHSKPVGTYWHIIKMVSNGITFTNPKTGVKRLCKVGQPIIFNNDGSYYKDLEYLEEYKL